MIEFRRLWRKHTAIWEETDTVRVLLVSNRYKKNTALMAEKISARLAALDIEALVDSGEERVRDSIDNIIVLGGDGTIIRAARQYAWQQIPVLGVNMGTVGFLSNIGIGELEEMLPRLINGDYTLDCRMMLEASVYNQGIQERTVYCLNEVVIKSGNPRMVSFNLQLDNSTVTTYRGDGLLMATPTGSSAYSFSAGGPLVDPRLEAILITPIAPYLHWKPVVVQQDREITITPIEGEEVLLCVDGQVNIPFGAGCLLKVHKAPMPLKMVMLKSKQYLKSLESRYAGGLPLW